MQRQIEEGERGEKLGRGGREREARVKKRERRERGREGREKVSEKVRERGRKEIGEQPLSPPDSVYFMGTSQSSILSLQILL